MQWNAAKFRFPTQARYEHQLYDVAGRCDFLISAGWNHHYLLLGNVFFQFDSSSQLSEHFKFCVNHSNLKYGANYQLNVYFCCKLLASYYFFFPTTQIYCIVCNTKSNSELRHLMGCSWLKWSVLVTLC